MKFKPKYLIELLIITAILSVDFSFALGQKSKKSQNLKQDTKSQLQISQKTNFHSINNLNKEAHGLLKHNPDSAYNLAHFAYDLSVELNYPEGKINSLKNMGFAKINKNQFKTGNAFLQNALNEAKISSYKMIDASLKFDIGVFFKESSNPEQALTYLKAAIVQFDILKAYKRKVMTISNIGSIYIDLGAYALALEQLYGGLKIAEDNKFKLEISIISTDIGIVYHRQEDYQYAEKYFDKALKIAQSINDTNQIAMCLTNLAVVYSSQLKFKDALSNYFHAISLYKKTGGKDKISTLYVNVGKNFLERNDYVQALKFYNKAVESAFESGKKEDIVVALIYSGEIYLRLKQYDSAESFFNRCINYAKELNAGYWIQYAYSYLSQINEIKGDFKSAYHYSTLYSDMRDSLYNQDKINEISRIEIKYENAKTVEKAKAERKTLIIILISVCIGFLLLSVLAFVVFHLYNVKKRSNSELAMKNDLLSKEQEKSHNLLLNILPETIAVRLIEGETNIADSHDAASVIFIDIAEFTKMSTGCSPQAMVKDLNNIFTLYDKISAKYGIEKIKTIGDCYMAASGIPLARDDHAEAIACVAIEVSDALSNYVSEIGMEFRFRIGLDCGPVVAGVIGEQKFIYDLWGDTVNTASRMQDSGMIGKIQCTDRFKNKCDLENVKFSLSWSHKYQEIQFVERGEIEIKGKGLMKTWLLEC